MFLLASLPLKQLHLFFFLVTTTSLSMWLFASRSSSDHGTISHSLYTSICVQFRFHFQRYHFFSSLVTSSFVDQIPLSSIHLAKFCPRLITGGQGGHTAACFAVCVWREQQMCSDLASADFGRSARIAQWSWCTPVIHAVFVNRRGSNETWTLCILDKETCT